MNSEDKLLVWWMGLETIGNLPAWLYVMYLVAHGHSFWWLVLVAACSYTKVYEALYKRLGIEI